MIGIAASRTAIEYEYRCTEYEYEYDESNRCRLGTRSLR